MKIRMF
jgi:hypothetical protein